MKSTAYQFSKIPVEVPYINTEHRRIKTAIPAPGTDSILSELEEYESRSMQGQLPIVWDHAENFSIFDKSGNRWIDFTSTIFVANVGHANPRVVEAIKRALEKPLLHTYAYANELRSEYTKKLIEFCGRQFEKVFLLSAGTEATEAGLKLTRMYGQKKGKIRPGIICFEGNWHGRTMGAQMMSSNAVQKNWIGYSDPNIYHLPFPYPWVLENISGSDFLKAGIDSLISNGLDLKKDICGFMLETFQGWGAVFYPLDFVQTLEEICRANDILLVFDEMQSGFGRTGKRFGYEHYAVKPDLICCGKGMGSGIPVSGVLGSAEIMDLPDVGSMSSTHSANPLACTAGLATLEEIENRNLIRETARKGILMHERLNNIKIRYSDCVKAVLGKGLIAALIFKKPQTNQPDLLLPSKLSEKCMQKGLLVVHTGRESIKIGPPLTITDEALVEGIEVIEESLDEVIRQV
jgi:4-aminobutyrate aminotransferase-like enzyme